MSRRLILPILLLAAGCNRPAAAPEDNEAAPPTEAALPAAENVTDALALPPPPSDAFPKEVVVSTNEPFWQARIGPAEATLSGAGQAERRLKVVETASDSEGRHVMARDGAFTVEAVISDAPCEDSMSGARFPYSGRLVIDGGPPIEGCARSAADPPPKPPEE